MNDLMVVEYDSASGNHVKLDLATVQNYVTKGNGKISQQEFVMFAQTCKAKGLDPFEAGEVNLIKYGDKAPAQIVIGYHAYIKRAEKHPDYAGYKSGIIVVRDGQVIRKEGACIYKILNEVLIGGWCRVFRKKDDVMLEFYEEVSMDEYNKGQSNWNTMPASMIKKTAVSQAFRAAFPSEYEGLYTGEEMQASGAIPADYVIDESTGEVKAPKKVDMSTVQEAVVVDVEDAPITKEQRQMLFKMAKENLGESPNEVLMDILGGFGYTNTQELTVADYKAVCDKIIERTKVAEEIEEPVNEDI